MESLVFEEVPANPFVSWFGIDEALIARVMAELVSRGADDAELFFEYQQSNSVSFQDGQLSQAASGVDLGVGLRVVSGDRVGFTFTEDLSEMAMINAARTAAAISQSQPPPSPASFRYSHGPNHYPIKKTLG